MSGPLIIPTKVFRETPSVFFLDATIPGSNGCDVVTHGPGAISPPMDGDHFTFYVHYHQVDRNLCVWGSRIFYLAYEGWEQPYHKIYIDNHVGSIQIPIGCYHRSVSGREGSVLINQSDRTELFDTETEFIPVSTRDNAWLRDVTRQEPVVWIAGSMV